MRPKRRDYCGLYKYNSWTGDGIMRRALNSVTSRLVVGQLPEVVPFLLL